MSAEAATAPAAPPPADAARPTRQLPAGQLVRLSLYWLGLSCVFIGLIHDPGRPDHVRGPGRRDDEGDDAVHPRLHGDDHRGHRPAHHRFDQRLHRQPLGSPQALHLHRQHAGRRLPAGHRDLQHGARDRGVHGAPPVQRQLRPGAVPGLHPGPRAREAGRHRVGAGGAVPGPGQRGGVRDRRDRRRHEQLLARHDGAGRPGVRDHARRSSSGCDEGRTPEVTRRPELAIHRGGGLGHGHPEGALLRLARLVPLVRADGHEHAHQLRDLLLRAVVRDRAGGHRRADARRARPPRSWATSSPWCPPHASRTASGASR